ATPPPYPSCLAERHARVRAIPRTGRLTLGSPARFRDTGRVRHRPPTSKRGVRSAPVVRHYRRALKPGERMPTVIAHHDVKDTKHWLASPKREEVFGPLGVTNIRTFVDPQNPTHVALLMDVADMDAVMAFMQAEAMDYDGVLPETLVILVEE